MPEVISKYPEIVLKLLKDAGATCGGDAKQKILKDCPKNQFCTLPTGEICIYGIHQVKSMTQISSTDLAEITSDVPTLFSSWGLVVAIVACLSGIIFGMLLKRR